MPLTVKIHHNARTIVGIWTVQETMEKLIAKLDISDEEKIHIDSLSIKKQLEWCASRRLIKSMLHDDVPHKLSIFKDIHGKPYIENSSAHISLSHSHDCIAAIISSDQIVGIDVQLIVDKIVKISPKFLSEPELSYCKNSDDPLLAYHIYWGAKECIFKSYGRGEVDFKNHILLNDLGLVTEKGRFGATFKKNGVILHFELYYFILPSYVLVYSLQEMDINN
ncbi:MAG: 4'-phosphopantetheinyl transferase superfamily protein [Saprospiraceae bacterium]